MTEVPDVFKNKKIKVKFIDGPAKGDSIRLDNETFFVDWTDSNKKDVRYTYMRTTVDELSFMGEAVKKGASHG